MSRKSVSLTAVVCLLLSGAPAWAQKIDFDSMKPGEALPAEWMATLTGRGTSKFEVNVDPKGPAGSPTNVLKQSGVGTYPLALLKTASVQDGFVEVKFKALDGKEDRAAGIVWRAKDANNYYIVRANALEDNVVLYKTVNGTRSSLPLLGKSGGYGTNAPVPPNTWHTIRVEFAGTRHRVIYNGKMLFEVEDKTFTQAGMVGVWTKADSVTVFDDFEYGRK